ncbi:hypothetical protein QFC21_005222 [Naganishia friedmannii]|uniref:Uncharacterized protein n=1 Tax=Naganishia friedmannii TaxID=89922 RepID=A0ACC2VAM6_9TREE|nr:hypothetical protein QFC21_005222 [Naganishia friedmannii]
MPGQQSYTRGPAPSAHTQRYTTSGHPTGQVDSQSSTVGPIYHNSGYQPTSQDIDAWMTQQAAASGDQQAGMDQMQYSSYVDGSRALPQHGVAYQPIQQVSNSNGHVQHHATSDLNMVGHQGVKPESKPPSAHPTAGMPQGYSRSAFPQPTYNGHLAYPTNDYQNAQMAHQPFVTAESLSNLTAADLSAFEYVFNVDPGWAANIAPSQMTSSHHQVSDAVDDAFQIRNYPVWQDGQVGGHGLPMSEAAAMTNGYLAETRTTEHGAQQPVWQVADPSMPHVKLAYQDHAHTPPVHARNAQTSSLELKQSQPESNANGNSVNHSTANALQVNTGGTSQIFNNDISQGQYWDSNAYQTGCISEQDLPQHPISQQTQPHSLSRGTHQQQSNSSLAAQDSISATSIGPTYDSTSNTGWQAQQKTLQQPQMVQSAPRTLDAAQQGLPDTTPYHHTLQQTRYSNQSMLKGMNAATSSMPQFRAYVMPMQEESPNMVWHSAMPGSAGYLKHSAITNHFGDLSLNVGELASSAAIVRNLQQYMSTASRYALGERKVVIHTPRVGQKSYGTEKRLVIFCLSISALFSLTDWGLLSRFLCPPPTACIIGLPWWQTEEDGKLRSPTINISLTGENPVPASMPCWTTIQNKLHEDSPKLRLTAQDPPFLGRVSNKSLHISDGTEPREDKKPRIVKAVMAIHIRDNIGQPGSEIGFFDSREIKIVSKPSKKRSSARTSELFLQHGTLITLFNRIKAQTSTTKFLAISSNLRQLLGSDGRPLPLSPNTATSENGFVADQNSWDPFTIWLVDPNKPQAIPETSPTPDAFFPPPSDAITMQNPGVAPIICFNNTVRLQCRATGLITPVMVIRKVDGPQTVQAFEGTRKENELSKCPVNELPGDPVCQLHKIAFELYASPVAPHSPVYGVDLRSPGSWLSCEQEGIAFRPGISARTWMSAPSTPPSRNSLHLSSSLPPSPGNHMSSLQPMTPRSVTSSNLPSAPESPVGMYSPSFVMSSQASSTDYFATRRQHNSGSSTPYVVNSPLLRPNEDPTENNGPGPYRRRRTSSGASLASIRTGQLSTPLMRPPPPRKRGSQQSIHGAERKENEHDALLWTIDISESATWTIVGAETKTYTFWIPPDVKTPSCPVTPFPMLNKYIPPGVAAETGSHLDKRYPGQFTSLVDAPLATFYGSGLAKKPDGEPLQIVYYGTQPAKHNEVRCTEVMNASIPESQGLQQSHEPTPIFLIKANGECIYPTPLTWKE